MTDHKFTDDKIIELLRAYREIVFMDRSEAIEAERKKLKAEAIKEFAERLIKKCDAPHWCVWMSEIEDLTKEMTEGQK